MALRRACFVSFEGIDGCGKSTQITRLQQEFLRRGFPCIGIREPGGSHLGEQLRELLLHEKDIRIDATAELLLFSAARAQLVKEVLRPALQDGVSVLCDRFFDSTLAYQGYGRGENLEEIRRVTDLAVAGLRPDRTFLLDIDPQIGLRRRENRESGSDDRMEAEGSDFLEHVRQGYLDLARREKDRFMVLDGTGTVDEIASIINEDIFCRFFS